jgi:hypothetical protein
MILPAGVNKLTGLRAALDELGLSEHEKHRDDHCSPRSCVEARFTDSKCRRGYWSSASHGARRIRACCRRTYARARRRFRRSSLRPALYWFRDTNQLRSSETVPAKSEHSRHKRKYVHGELESERSFYFTGLRGQFKLRAQNLTMFLRLAEGLDDETWQYHRQCGDYSAWFREAMRDNDLANEAGQIEKNRA